MTPARYCENRTRGSGSSFFYAFLFLPEEQRRAMMALYAFCREVDDIADEVTDRTVALQKIGFWREEIARVFEGTPQHPVGRELMWANGRFPMSRQLFEDILEGMLTDIAGRPILTDDDLSLYCYRVAGAVGLLSIEIFGYTNEAARQFATELGEALQLTNILRDIKDDMAIGRIYFPQQQRSRFHVADQDFKEGNHSAQMQALLAHYGERAEAAYRRAIDALPAEDRASLRPSLIMAAIYHAQLQRLKRYGFDVWRHSGHISPLRKMWLAWTAWRHERRAAAGGMPVRLDA